MAEAAVASMPTVYVVEGDPVGRDGIDRLLRSLGCAVHSFGSVTEFANQPCADGPACLVLDLRMPDALVDLDTSLPPEAASYCISTVYP